ncbi:rap guanine nucleotide exchange factor GEF2 [Capsaspora owczarzaki ATCC 30864]|uniref:rap guanine nucleotide exchange factor GEF2 n=1 Tax=Capsaspora owczarzaki (strain ATCC 30864) TaxID=595528 RepID=UPI00035267D1|nr:rap guanine nucleotide exchange factor GEF2 [Capsaspora owczarzaki ATCC 30864]|eukprot:XP_004365323.2 rap guanine nucleotide exchange factor GEF2 [Capsaspora owczarzaki ATCC 30864]
MRPIVPPIASSAQLAPNAGSVLGGAGAHPFADILNALSLPPAERSEDADDIIFTALRKLHALAKLRSARLHTIAATVTVESLPPGTVVFSQADDVAFWYGILRGAVSVTVYDEDDDTSHPLEVARLFEGQGFGDTAIMTDEPASSTIRTITACDLVKIGRAEFKGMMEMHLLDEMNAMSNEDRSPRSPMRPQAGFGRRSNDSVSKLIRTSSSGKFQGLPGGLSPSGSNPTTPIVAAESEPKKPILPVGTVSARSRPPSIAITVDNSHGDMSDPLPEGRSILPSPRVDPTLQERFMKPVSERTEDDLLDILQELNQLKALSDLTPAEKRSLAAITRFQVVPHAGDIVVRQGSQGATWYILAQGSVEVVVNRTTVCSLGPGESFGENLVKYPGPWPVTIITKEDECQLLMVHHADFETVFKEAASNTRIVRDSSNAIVMVMERRPGEHREGFVVMSAMRDQLVSYLVSQEDECDVHFLEDFLLMFRTFMTPMELWTALSARFQTPAPANQLISPILVATIRSKIVGVIFAWVRYYFNDFESDRALSTALDRFVESLQRDKLASEHDLLRSELDTIAAASARPSNATHSLGHTSHSTTALYTGSASAAASPEIPRSSLKTRTRSLSVTPDSMPKLFIPPMHSSVNSDKLFRGTLKASQRRERKSNNPLLYERKASVASVVRGGPDMDVVRVYRSDESYKTVAIQKTTSAQELVANVITKFNITDAPSTYKLVEVKLSGDQRDIPDGDVSLASQLSLNGRLYIKKRVIQPRLGDSGSGVNVTRSKKTLSKAVVAQESIDEEDLKPAPLPAGLHDSARENMLLEMDERDIARHITLQDYHLFSSTESIEYITLLWRHQGKDISNLLMFMQRFNELNYWVVTEVCSSKNTIRRVNVIKKFITIAKDLLSCNNFNAAFAILSGLDNVAVTRLHETWEKVPARLVAELEEMQMLMDPSRNMKAYRTLIQQTAPPAIPFFPLLMKDLTFMREGNDSVIEGRINFDLLRMISRAIRSLDPFRSTPYDSTTLLPAVRRRRTTVGTPIELDGSPIVVPNPVKDYLAGLIVIDDQRQLSAWSRECEMSAKERRAQTSRQSTRR